MRMNNAITNAFVGIVLGIVSGCAATPYQVEPQTVTVHFLDDRAWNARATELMLQRAKGMPDDVRGIARWRKDDDGSIVECHIYLPDGPLPSRETIAHELRHCTEGAFH